MFIHEVSTLMVLAKPKFRSFIAISIIDETGDPKLIALVHEYLHSVDAVHYLLAR